MIGVVATVGQQALEGSGVVDQMMRQADVVGVSRAEQQHARAALVIHQAVDLGGPAPSRATYALEEGPPLAPAAER